MLKCIRVLSPMVLVGASRMSRLVMMQLPTLQNTSFADLGNERQRMAATSHGSAAHGSRVAGGLIAPKDSDAKFIADLR